MARFKEIEHFFLVYIASSQHEGGRIPDGYANPRLFPAPECLDEDM